MNEHSTTIAHTIIDLFCGCCFLHTSLVSQSSIEISYLLFRSISGEDEIIRKYSWDPCFMISFRLNANIEENASHFLPICVYT